MDWRKYQNKFSWKPIAICTALNLLVAAAAFSTSLLLAVGVFQTIFYTLFAWTISVTVSFLYWIWWFFENIRNVPGKIKAAFTAVMLFLLVLDWMIIFGFLRLLT